MPRVERSVTRGHGPPPNKSPPRRGGGALPRACAPAGRDDDSILSTGCAALHPRPFACAPAGRDDDSPRILSTGCASLHPWPATCAPAGRDDELARILSTGCATLHPRPWACAPAGQDTDHPADFVTHPRRPDAGRSGVPKGLEGNACAPGVPAFHAGLRSYHPDGTPVSPERSGRCSDTRPDHSLSP